jgi:hypothetical protein
MMGIAHDASNVRHAMRDAQPSEGGKCWSPPKERRGANSQPVIPADELRRLEEPKILTCKITCENPVLPVLTRAKAVPDGL